MHSMSVVQRLACSSHDPVATASTGVWAHLLLGLPGFLLQRLGALRLVQADLLQLPQRRLLLLPARPLRLLPLYLRQSSGCRLSGYLTMWLQLGSSGATLGPTVA